VPNRLRRRAASRPEGRKIRAYVLPKPEEFRTMANVIKKTENIPPEDIFIVSMLVDELEKAVERIRSGDKYWQAMLDWAMGIVRFQRRVGIRRLQKIFGIISEVYEQKQE